MNAIEISVIIPTRNRPKQLHAALSSLASQTVPQPRFEVIVVDNEPSVETAAAIAPHSNRIANLRYVEEAAPGLHNARHRGMREACGEFLAFIDDDVEVEAGWLHGVGEGFSLYCADLVGGRNLPKWEGEPPGWVRRLWLERNKEGRAVGYLSILDFGDSVREIDPLYVWGCNFSIRKSLLVECGGFHPDSMPGELLHMRGDGESHVSRFAAAGGYRAVYVPGACVHHLVPKGRMTLDYFRRRAFDQGVSDSYSRLRQDPTATAIDPWRWPGMKSALRGKAFRLLPWRRIFRWEMDDWYRRGVRWHTQLFLEEQGVRDWVLRESYLDAGKNLCGSHAIPTGRHV